MSGVTVPTRERLKALWMAQPFAGPSEKWDAEANFDAMVTVRESEPEEPFGPQEWEYWQALR